MSAADRIEKLATGLYNDLEAADSKLCPWPDETKQQKLQLILDAFEQVGLLAMKVQSFVGDVEPYPTTTEGWMRENDRANAMDRNATQQEQTPH